MSSLDDDIDPACLIQLVEAAERQGRFEVIIWQVRVIIPATDLSIGFVATLVKAATSNGAGPPSQSWPAFPSPPPIFSQPSRPPPAQTPSFLQASASQSYTFGMSRSQPNFLANATRSLPQHGLRPPLQQYQVGRHSMLVTL